MHISHHSMKCFRKCFPSVSSIMILLIIIFIIYYYYCCYCRNRWIHSKVNFHVALFEAKKKKIVFYLLNLNSWKLFPTAGRKPHMWIFHSKMIESHEEKSIISKTAWINRNLWDFLLKFSWGACFIMVDSQI